MEEGEGEEEQQVVKLTPHALTKDELEKGLSVLSKTIDGSSFAFTKFSCPRVGLSKLDLLKTYKHLRYLELHENLLTDLSALEAMTYLLSLNLRKNNITNLKLPKLEYLQVLNVNENKIEAIEGLELPMLRFLYASKNAIKTVAGLVELAELERLELDGNQLKSCEGLGLPQLKKIGLANNQIASLQGLGDLSNVPILDLSNNQLVNLEGIPQSEALHTVILRGNKIDKPDEVEPLKSLPILKTLVLADNPVAARDAYRVMMVRRLPKLVTLDEEPITEEEQEAAKEPEAPPPEEAPADGEAPPEE